MASIRDQKNDLLREKVLREVRRSIATGVMAPDSRLTERSLCETYDVSRTIAREVIRQLESERLGYVVPHHGLRIARLTRRQVEDIFELRLMIEILLIRNFVHTATIEQIAHLRKLHDRLKVLSERAEYDLLVERSVALLDYMVEVSEKKIAGEILDYLTTRITVLRILAMKNPGQIEVGIGQLERIVDAVEHRDVESAEKRVREYMHAALVSALRQLALQRV